LTNARSDLNPILTELFRQNLWANLTLIDFCATLPEEILETNVPGTFGTIRETLGHLAGTEEGYLAGLVGDIESDSSSDEEASPNLATLRERALHVGEILALATMREHAVTSGEGLIAYAEAVEGNPTVRVVWFGQTYEMQASLFLVQAINHATEHRAQIKTALTQAGSTPPELDGWSWDRQKSGQRR
jgi:uncharacterized damage-inducible protein DinB